MAFDYALLSGKCDCRVRIYTLTSAQILERWDDICPEHQKAAKLAAESMLKTLSEIVSR